MRLSIDTNVYTALMRGDEVVVSQLKKASALSVSAIVVGELLFGFRHGTQLLNNRRQLESFLDEPYVHFLSVTLSTCDRYSMVAASLRAKGKPIPQNDIWIAAHALESGTDLLSFDGHFDHVDGLAFIQLG